jgi:hypothetical protein
MEAKNIVDLTGQSSNFLIDDLRSVLDCHAGLARHLKLTRSPIKSGMTPEEL